MHFFLLSLGHMAPSRTRPSSPSGSECLAAMVSSVVLRDLFFHRGFWSKPFRSPTLTYTIYPLAMWLACDYKKVFIMEDGSTESEGQSAPARRVRDRAVPRWRVPQPLVGAINPLWRDMFLVFREALVRANRCGLSSACRVAEILTLLSG